MNNKIIDAWGKYVAGNTEVFGEIYQYYRPILTFYCLGQLKNHELAESYSSETLIKAYEMNNPETIRDIESWLFTVAKNLCISYHRQNSRRREIHEEISKSNPKAEEPIIDHQLSVENIDEIISSELKDEERLIWKLHCDGFNNAEISQQLKMIEKTVANKKSEIRKRLKKAVGKYFTTQEK